MEYAEQARKFVEDRYGADADPLALEVLDRWESVLTRLEADPMSLAGELDWVAKLALLEGYRERDGLDWSHARLELVDLQYSDLRPEKSIYQRLVDDRSDAAAPPRRRGRARGRPPARGHPRLLPRPLPHPVRRRGRRRVLGLGDLRSARPGLACSASRRWTRPGAPRPTSARCSTVAPRPASSSPR